MINKVKPYKDIVLEFDDEKHRFTIEGRSIISVTGATSIIDKSRPLIFWAIGLAKNHLLEKLNSGQPITEADILEASQQHSIVKEKAATIGDMVHTWAEEYITGKKPKIPEDEKVKNGVLAFMKWIDETKIEIVESERIGYSKKYNFAGILDAIGKMGKKTILIDFKTSKQIYPEMSLQVAGYQIMYEEETKKKIDKRIIVRFGKDDGEFEIKELDNDKEDKKAFLSALELKKYLYGKQ